MKKLSGSAISRLQVFVLADGTFVVQWDDKRVQELYTGRYRDFEHQHDFGHHITDYELNVLKAAGRVEYYNRKYVWLYPLPESGRYATRRTLDRSGRVRGYYISTGLPRSQINNVRATLDLVMPNAFKLGIRANTIVILDVNGHPFHTLQEVEALQAIILERTEHTLGELSIAFIELDPKRAVVQPDEQEEALPSLDEIIASQSDTSATAGRQIVLAISNQEEREAFTDLFIEMRITLHHAERGSDALAILEDHHPDLLITDITLPDMHGIQLVTKIKEIPSLREMPIVLVASESTLSITVARVEMLTRPVSIARLRFMVWKILRERVTNPRQTP